MQTSRKPAWTTVHLNVLEYAVCILTRLGRTTLVEIEVIGDKQIELAIPVVVDPGAARAPTRPVRAQSGFPGYVGESAVPIVVVEEVLAPVRDEQILKPIVIVVANTNSGRPTCAEQARFGGYVGEGAVPIILVEPVRRARRSSREARPAKDENIHPAIVIVVEECAATPHGFDDIVFAIDAAVNGGGVQAGRLRHIGESSYKRDAGRFSARCGLRSAGGNALRAQIDATTQERKACHEADKIATGGLHVISVRPAPPNPICHVAAP